MRTLYTPLKGSPGSQYRFSNVSNLTRVSLFNQSKITEYALHYKTSLPNQHPLVQLMLMLGIEASWSQRELISQIELKKEQCLAMVNATGVYRKGRLQQDVFFMEGIHELLISLPNQLEINQYFTIDESELCGIIPIYSESLDLDYRLIYDRSSKRLTDKLAIIGLDLYALAIGYWRHLNSSSVNAINVRVASWLAGRPMLNAQLLANRLLFINLLYEGRDVDNKKLTINIPRTPVALNSIQPYLNDAVDNLDELHKRKALNNLETLFSSFPVMDGLDFVGPNYWLDPKKYSMYNNSYWVWDFAYMKSLSVLFYYNEFTGVRNGELEGNVRTWLRRDLNTTVNLIPDNLLKEKYKKLRQQLSQYV